MALAAALLALLLGLLPRGGEAAPCDIFARGGTPCVAAHSVTRALFAGYHGPLYQVLRTTDRQSINRQAARILQRQRRGGGGGRRPRPRALGTRPVLRETAHLPGRRDQRVLPPRLCRLRRLPRADPPAYPRQVHAHENL